MSTQPADAPRPGTVSPVGAERPRHSRHGLAYAALAAAGCCWGTGFFLGKIALRELGVAHLIFYRFVFATLGFLPVVFFRRVRIRAGDWGLLVAASFFGVPVMFLTQFEGLAHTTVSHAALMVGTSPVFLAVSAGLLFHERLGRVGWLALAGSTTGVLLVVLPTIRLSGGGVPVHGGPTLWGDLLVLVSLLAGLLWVLVSKHLMHRYPPLVVSAYITLVGGLMLGVWVLARNGLPPTTLSPVTWGALVGQGVLATTVATMLWNWGLSLVPASHAGVFQNFEPIIGTLLGVLVLHEPLGTWTVAGGALIVSAAVVMTWRGTQTV